MMFKIHTLLLCLVSFYTSHASESDNTLSSSSHSDDNALQSIRAYQMRKRRLSLQEINKQKEEQERLKKTSNLPEREIPERIPTPIPSPSNKQHTTNPTDLSDKTNIQFKQKTKNRPPSPYPRHNTKFAPISDSISEEQS